MKSEHEYDWVDDLKVISIFSSYHKEMAKFLKYIITGLGKNLKIIDVGCGLGYTINELLSITERDLISEIELVDKCQQSIENSKSLLSNKKMKIIYKNKDIEKLKLSKKKYNLIIASHLFYYVKSKDELIRFLIKHLEKDGLLIIVIRSIKSQTYSLRCFLGEILNQNKKYYSSSDFKNLLNDNRFKYLEYELKSELSIPKSAINSFIEQNNKSITFINQNILSSLLRLQSHNNSHKWSKKLEKQILDYLIPIIKINNSKIINLDDLFVIKKN